MIEFGLLGLMVGSFLNVCIDRLPLRQSLVHPASHCPACRQRILRRDLVPVVSYLWLRGRCRFCRARIPLRLPAVELGTGLIFAFLRWRYGIGPELAVAALYYCVLCVILVIDLEHGLILNRVVYPSSALALVIAVAGRQPGLAMAAAGGGVGLALLLAVALLYRGGMGWGDVKMAGMAGLMVGFPGVLAVVLLAVVSGGLVAAALVVSKARGMKQSIAFGPFLSIGTMVTILWGNELMGWYVGLF